jgi:hypothetical protein
MNTSDSKQTKFTLVVPVVLPAQLTGQIPERYSKSQAWRTHLTGILAKKVTESDVISAIKKSTASKISDGPEQPDPANGIPVTITSDFNLGLFNRNVIKREIGNALRARVRIEDLLLACERTLRKPLKEGAK